MSESTSEPAIDRVSFMLGMINCFVEMVACGVKRLALSPPLSPEDHDVLGATSAEIAERSGVQWHLETSLMVTDLQSPDFTAGKVSILYFKEQATLEAYQELKRRKSELEAQGRYTAEQRRQISREFMQLLSYPDHVIEDKLAQAGSHDPYMHVSSGSE